MSALQAYLEKHYLGSADSSSSSTTTKPKKHKKKSKSKTSTTGLFLVDEDPDDWTKDGTDTKRKGRNGQYHDDDDEFMKPVVATDVNGDDPDALERKFKKGTDAGWVTIQESKVTKNEDETDRHPPRSPSLSPVEKTRRGRHPSRSPSLSPRQNRARSQSPSLSPPPRRSRRSPSRSPSVSPRQRSRHARSPSRSRSRSPSPSFQERRRQRGHTSPSPSPPRHHRRHRSPSLSPKRSSPQKEPTSTTHDKNKNIPRMSDGTVAGLQTGSSVKRDLEAQRRLEKSRLESMDPQESGKFAQTIYRDKHGQKIDVASEKAELAAERRRQEALEEAQMEWGVGLKQKAHAREAAQRLEREKYTKFATYADDQDRNEELKDVDRWGDPMAGKVSSKKRKVARPLYQGPPPPPNRFNIPPGYRWDGVDRSNGFEKEYFQQQNAKAVLKEEAYKWSTENM